MMLAAHAHPGRRRCGRSDIRGRTRRRAARRDGELHGRWDALTVSQRRAIAALASGEAPISQTAARQHGHQQGRDR